MKMRFSPRVLGWVVALLTAIAAAVPPARAEEDPHSVTVTVSMDQAVKMAEQRFKARVVRAEAQRDGDSTIYVLRMLNESGRVWIVRVDASSGAVL